MTNTKQNSQVIKRCRSRSNPDRRYSIRQNKINGQLSCNCPGWIFKRKNQERSCKHIRKVLVSN